jgi:WD40 repeat protein
MDMISFVIVSSNAIDAVFDEISLAMNKFIPIVIFAIASTGSYAQNLETIIQKGHELAVVAVAVSPDSNFVATASKDKSIKLWELSTAREIRSFLGHEMTVSSIDISADGRVLLSGSYDKSARLWDIATGKLIATLSGNDAITDVGIDPKMRFIVTAGYNRSGDQDSATIYDFSNRNVIKRIPVNADEGRGFGVSIQISSDGEFLAFGEDNRVVNIYKTKNWEKLHTIAFKEGWCGGCATMVSFAPDNKSFFSASNNGSVDKYEIASGNLIENYESKTEDLTGLTVSSDGKYLARATEKDVVVFDALTKQKIATLNAAEKGEFHRIKFTNNSNKLLISSDDNTAFVWNLITQKKEEVLTGFLNARDQGGLNYDPNFYWQSAIAKYVRFKNTLMLSRDGKSLIKGKFGTRVKQWDIATGKSVMDFSAHKKAVLAYDISRDGKRLLTGGGDGAIILWDMETGDTLKVIRSYREPIFDIHFNSDETLAASSSWDATMKIHDLSTGKLLTYFEFESYSAYNILMHPNDLYVFSARLDNSLQLWELDTKTVVRNFVGHTDVISSLHLSQDQKTLMSGSWDGSIRLWDVSSGLMIRKIKTKSPVYTAVYSADGKLIYSGQGDRTINVWDAGTGKLVKALTGHNSEITSLLFSNDNRMLISHSVDGVTKFWDVSSGQEFFEHIHLGETEWMVKNPDGYFNGTGEARKYIHFVNGMKSYSVDQFFNDFYRPDLLPKIFQTRGGGEMKGIQGKLLSSPPPTVRIAVLPSGEGRAELIMRLTDNGAGVVNPRIFHNGKNIALETENLSLPSGKNQNSTYRQMINLVTGQNTFTATASNKEKIEADPHSAEIFSDHASRSSVCHILAVGINEYKNPKMSLNYAKPDAMTFGKIVDEKATNLFKSVELHTLYDKDATREKILSTLEELKGKVQQEDVFIFYYAGHGSMVDNQFYFIPTETLRLYDASTLNKEAIEASVLQEKFKNIKALKQLIIMDACQSGGSVELLANRGASEEKAIAQLSRSAGIHVMASAGSEQFAAEFSSLGHGLFTHVLIRALQGEADGAPKDGKVTIYELKSFIDDQVPEMTRKLKGKPQYPYTFSRGQDFPVVIE